MNKTLQKEVFDREMRYVYACKRVFKCGGVEGVQCSLRTLT